MVAALVRLADELDEDRRRADEFEERYADIPLASKPYWRFSQRISGIGIGDPGGDITIYSQLEVNELRGKPHEPGLEKFLTFFAEKLAKINRERAHMSRFLGEAFARTRLSVVMEPPEGLPGFDKPKRFDFNDDMADDEASERDAARQFVEMFSRLGRTRKTKTSALGRAPSPLNRKRTRTQALNRVPIHDFTMPARVLGREGVIAHLSQMLRDGVDGQGPRQVSVVAVTALGGIGKSTLARHLWDSPEVCSPFQYVIWFSFYDQRTRDEASFFSSVARAVGLNPDHPPSSPKVPGPDHALSPHDVVNLRTRLTKYMAEKPILLVLDGLEVIQHVADERDTKYGRIVDSHRQVLELLKTMCVQSSSRALITSRTLLWDLKGVAGYAEVPLDVLDDAASAALLSSLGVRGKLAVLQRCAMAFRGHALSLRAAGLYMTKYQISAARYTREVIADAALFRETPEGEKVARIVGETRKRLTDDQQHFLKMLAVHRRPVDSEDFPVVARQWRREGRDASWLRVHVIRPLVALGLVNVLETASGEQQYSAHALMKFAYSSWFDADGVRDAHAQWARAAVGSPDTVFALSAGSEMLERYVTAVEDYIDAGEAAIAWRLYEPGWVHSRMHNLGHVGEMRQVMEKFAGTIDSGQWKADVAVEEKIFRCLKTSCHQLDHGQMRDIYARRQFEAIKRTNDPQRIVQGYAAFAQALAYAGQVTEAKRCLEEGKNKFTAHWSELCRMIEAEVAHIAGDLKMAEQAMRKISVEELDATHRDHLPLIHAAVLIDLGRYEEADAILTHLLGSITNRVERESALAMATMCAVRLGDLTRARSLDEQNNEVRRSLGLKESVSREILLDSGEAESIIARTETPTTMQGEPETVPERISRLAWRARALVRLKRAKQARTAIAEARALMDESEYRVFEPELFLAEQELNQAAKVQRSARENTRARSTSSNAARKNRPADA
jgi:tetratricopeptide (TPR) repeat protein